MKQRRPLIAGLDASNVVDRAVEEQFVKGGKPKLAEIADMPGAQAAPTEKPEGHGKATKAVSRVPLSTRIRSDFATALKRASLERQLSGTIPSTLQHILEDALEPWLRSNGYLK
jgi:hypothetical protein